MWELVRGGLAIWYEIFNGPSAIWTLKKDEFNEGALIVMDQVKLKILSDRDCFYIIFESLFS